MDRLEAKFQQCLLGIQIGDAMGMPVEIMTPEEILAATDGKGVTGFIEPVQRRIHDTMDLKAGDTTDDWQLTQVVAESLIAMGEYDQHDQALRHIAAYRASKFGWGGTTMKGIESLITGRNPHESPDSLGPGRGCGNGVAMKIAPIALYVAARHGDTGRLRLREIVMEHGKLTHPDIRAAISAHALAYGIWYLLMNPLLRAGGWTMKLARARFMRAVIKEVRETEEAYNDTSRDYSVSFRIDRASIVLDDRILLREAVGTGCIAIESVPFALATFARHYDSYKNGILEAVNAGGDTDTIASMVGALIGANNAGESIMNCGPPITWTDGLHDKGVTAKNLGSTLYRVAKK